MIYHITTPVEFSKYDDKAYFEAVSLHTEGFIHCSTLPQIKETVARYFEKIPEILILTIDELKLSAELEYELSRNNEEFPHIYGRLNKEAIMSINSYSNNNGNFNIDID